MTSHFHHRVLGFVSTCTLVATLGGAEAKSDLNRPEARRAVVELATRLSEPPPLDPLPADLVHPFNPAAFGQPDPEELKALAAAQAAASAAAVQTKPTTDRDFLQLIASRIMPSGTLMIGGDPLLIFGRKRLRVGDHLTVSYDGRDYELELTGIDRTTFTLRLNHDEITRPIKSAKSP
jgi:hypothetical protein